MPGKYDAEPQTTTTKSNFASFGAGVLFPSTIKTNEPAETTTTNERTNGKKGVWLFLGLGNTQRQHTGLERFQVHR